MILLCNQLIVIFSFTKKNRVQQLYCWQAQILMNNPKRKFIPHRDSMKSRKIHANFNLFLFRSIIWIVTKGSSIRYHVLFPVRKFQKIALLIGTAKMIVPHLVRPHQKCITHLIQFMNNMA